MNTIDGPKDKAKRNKYDAIVIGSGPNGLAAGIALAKAGLSVLLVESRSTIGGGCRSAELTLPGYRHDVCSSVYPLGYGSPFFRSLPLHEFGLQWINPEVSYAHPLDEGEALLVYRSIEKTAQQLGVDASHYQKLMQSLNVNWDNLSEILLHPFEQKNISKVISHPFALANFGLRALMPLDLFCATEFNDRYAPAVFAGVSAHSGLPLNAPASTSIGLVLHIAAHALGWPIPVGGAQKLADALATYFVQLNGEILTDCPISSLSQLPESRFIICDLMPAHLSVIAEEQLPDNFKRELNQYKHGPGSFKIDWALSAPIPWNNQQCLKAPTVHLGGSFAEIADSELAVNQGQHSSKPYVLLAQHTLFDSSRAPNDKHTAWAYCHVPNSSEIDMTEIIENQIERFADGFKAKIIARHTMPPKKLAAYNPNYIGGDVNGGALYLSQLFTRPTKRFVPYSTPNKSIYLCSAATPPGSGVHGMSGYYAALTVLHNWRRITR